MFSTFFRFELGFWLRGMMMYIFLGVVAALVIGATSSDNVTIGASLSNMNRNAPFAIQQFYAVMSMIGCLMATAFVTASATRDFGYDTSQMIFTKPLKKYSYLLGKFWASVLIATLPLLGVSLGVLLSPAMFWTDVSRFGDVYWGAHLWGILVFAIPNTIFISCIVYAVATLTRSTMASFVSILGLFVFYILTRVMMQDIDNQTIAQLTDPFGVASFRLATRYWTVAEYNTQFVTLSGMMLWNRLIWVGIGMMFLAVSCWRFSFADRKKRSKKTADVETSSQDSRAIPAATCHYGLSAQMTQLWSQIKLDFWGIVKSPIFMVVMGFGVFDSLVGLFVTAGGGFGVSALPVTYDVIGTLRDSMYLYLIIVITFYTGALVWRERESKLDEVFDATPHPTWLTYTAKMISMMFVVMSVMAIGIVCGLIVQTYNGYDRYQLGLYFQEFFMLDLIQFFCLVVLAFLSHVVSPNKYVGYFLFILLVVLNTFIWSGFEIQTLMVRYGSLPFYEYSDMYELAPFSAALGWFSLYWGLAGIIVSIAIVLFWRRGRETGFFNRIGIALSRWKGVIRLASVIALFAWIGVGSWIAYNTQVLNAYDSAETIRRGQAEYEKKFKEHEWVAQPKVTAIRYEIDIFPDRRGIEFKGTHTIKNDTAIPIKQMYINYSRQYETSIEIDGATLAEDFEHLGYQIYDFADPLQPGAETELKFELAYVSQGFENDVSIKQIVQNGTFFNNKIAPVIGYNRSAEMSDKEDRKEHGLAAPEIMPPLDPTNTQARMRHYVGNEDWVELDTVISTSDDQIAIAPGSLIKKWEKDGRRYFHYKLDHPSLNFFSFISADYKVALRKWKDVDVEVYYHHEHEWNVDNMLRSIRKSLEYYSENFGPYMHKQARIIEFPRVAQFAQAFPGTMPYSEGIGFIADLKDDEDIDMVYYVVAHEMAHQWWAHQVIGAGMDGATLLSETLAQYSALMVMEKEYGRDMMRKFLKYEMDQYLGSRGSEQLKEKPLQEVVASQGYIHYRKGSVVMYYLKEMIGEDKVNKALRSIIDKFGYQKPPFPTSIDLVEALRAETPPELQYLLKDLFEDITLFANRTTKSSYRDLGNGKYEVSIDVTCEKIKMDDEGIEQIVPIDDWIEIGAFAKPEPGKKYGATLYRKRVKITESKSTFSFEVDGVPEMAGIDPFLLLIDRMPKDNSKLTTLVE